MNDLNAISDLINEYEIAVKVHLREYGKHPVKTLKRLKRLKHRLIKETEK